MRMLLTSLLVVVMLVYVAGVSQLVGSLVLPVAPVTPVTPGASGLDVRLN